MNPANIVESPKETNQLTETDKKRILIADDVEAVTTLLVTALEIAGYEVIVARNGQQALELGRDQGFDLAILDQLMPGLLGIEILKQWREAGIEVPVIVLSGVEDDETVVGSLESGATDFIRKPFRLPELMARVKLHLG
ncbi:MAG: response regulator transcription factor [Acidimicrobiia bacterium]|nr:response regulator transcription factor [Acidimicrobiia bacterium]